MDVPATWYEGFFEGDWLDQVALRAPEEETAKQVEFLASKLALPDGARVLDVACGHGRFAVPLARRGYRVTGIDLSPRSLELARTAAAQAGVGVEWLQQDMRDLGADASFDAAINVYTSFGYFDDDAENQRVLDAVAQVLVPGGVFLVDVVNLLGLVRRYAERRWDAQEDVLVLGEQEFDVLRGRDRARWTFVRPDGTRSELVHSLRVYAPHELAAMLERAGLQVEDGWGGFDGSELSLDSPRLILLARKPR